MPGPAFLHGETVALHTIETEDVSFLHETINDPAVREGLTIGRPLSERAEREWVESVGERDGDEVHLLICVDGERVGTIGLNDIAATNGHAELGYYLTEDAWGNGYTTDAARTLVDHGFAALRLHRLYAKVFDGNEGSRRVLEKVGFEREGTLRDHWYRHGAHEDVHVYGLLADEWDGR